MEECDYEKDIPSMGICLHFFSNDADLVDAAGHWTSAVSWRHLNPLSAQHVLYLRIFEAGPIASMESAYVFRIAILAEHGHRRILPRCLGTVFLSSFFHRSNGRVLAPCFFGRVVYDETVPAT